jgi:hypothetical protein
MITLKYAFFILLTLSLPVNCFSYSDAPLDENFDFGETNDYTDAPTQAKTTLPPNPPIAAEPEDLIIPETSTTSQLQNKIMQLKEKLKNFNKEAKKIVPNADKQIKESQKRRQEKQKKAQQQAQHKPSGYGYSPSSRSGGKGYYGSPGSSEYKPYSPGKSYGGPSYSGSSSAYPSPGFDAGSSSFDKDKSGMGKGFDKKEDSLKSTSTEAEKAKDKKRGGTDAAYSKEQKAQKQAADKVTAQTENIKTILKNLVYSLDASDETTEAKKAETRSAIYDQLLTEGGLKDLSDELRDREKMARSITPTKKKELVPVDSAEKRLWERFLPYLMQLFIHPLDDSSHSDIGTCKSLLNKLQPAYLSKSDVKNAQVKIEQTLLSDLKKEFPAADKKLEEPTGPMLKLESQAKSFPHQPIQNQELKDYIQKIKNLGNKESTK